MNRVLAQLASLTVAFATGATNAMAQETAVPPSHQDSFWQRDALTGDWGGARSGLESQGYRISLNLTTETFADVGGGVRQGAIYEDLIEAALDVDLDKAFGWDGALFHVNGYVTNGRGLSAHYLDNNYLTVSNIEADRGDRLFDLWLQKTFLEGRLSVRAGQIAANDEFFISHTAALFLNGSYGWPAIMSANLPSGGPNYPLATPGGRAAYAMNDRISLKAGVFDGNPAGPGPGNPLARDPHGTSFSFNGGAFLIAEATYRPEHSNTRSETDASQPSEYKLGLWYHTGGFADEEVDDTGHSLADLTSLGRPLQHQGDYGIYLVVDQTFGDVLGARNVAGFLRASVSPGNRDVISTFLDTGLSARGFRENDVVGLAFTYAGMGSGARGYDRSVALLIDPSHPLRTFEGDLELSYQATLAPWWVVQPDVQVVIHPGGNITAAGRLIPTATVIGFRSVVVF